MSNSLLIVHWLVSTDEFFELVHALRAWSRNNPVGKAFPDKIFEFAPDGGNMRFMGRLTCYAFGVDPDGTDTCLFCLNGDWIKVCCRVPLDA